MRDNRGLEFLNVSVSDRPKYVTTFALQGVRVTMRCGYNTRSKLRWIILLDDNGDILLPQTFLKYGRRCELGFVSNQYNLNHYVTLRPKDTSKVFPESHNYLNWSRDFNICFVGYPRDVKINSDILIRELIVGN